MATSRDEGATARRAVEDAEAAQQVGAALCDCMMVVVLLLSRRQLQQAMPAAGHVSIHSQQAWGMQSHLSRCSHPVASNADIERGVCLR